MSIDQLDLLEGDEEDFDLDAYWEAQKEATRERKRQRRREAGPPDYRKVCVPGRADVPFVIVPQIARHLHRLAEVAGKEAGVWEQDEDSILGVQVLAARTAIVLNHARERAGEKPITVDGVARRIRDVVKKKQLFVNANLVEACLMAMDAEHEIQYGQWPVTKAAALERVSIEAELAGKKLSPDKLLSKANRLWEKGVRKAYRRACEVNS